MTRWLPGRPAVLFGLIQLTLVCVCLLLPGQAAAARVAVVLSEDAAPYQEAYQALQSHLDASEHAVYPVYVDDLSASSVDGRQLIIAVGVRAADAVAALPTRTPVLAVMVPRNWYLKTGRMRLVEGGRRELSAIFVDQPFERQAALIRQALPEARRVGIVLSGEQASLAGELERALQAHQLRLTSAILPAEARLVATMEGVLPDADLLLAVPDPLVFNRNTAQSLFLTTYRYRTPVLGYSRSMTRAGALLSLHSSPAQIGRQAAETVIGAFRGGTLRLPPPAYPVYFSVSINEKVARSLGHALVPEAELEQRLGARP